MKQLLATLLAFILAVLFVAAVFAMGAGLIYILYHYWAYALLAALVIGLTIGFYSDMMDFVDNTFRRFKK